MNAKEEKKLFRLFGSERIFFLGITALGICSEATNAKAEQLNVNSSA